MSKVRTGFHYGNLRKINLSCHIDLFVRTYTVTGTKTRTNGWWGLDSLVTVDSLEKVLNIYILFPSPSSLPFVLFHLLLFLSLSFFSDKVFVSGDFLVNRFTFSSEDKIKSLLISMTLRCWLVLTLYLMFWRLPFIFQIVPMTLNNHNYVRLLKDPDLLLSSIQFYYSNSTWSQKY